MLATINGEAIFSLILFCKVIDVVSGPKMSKNNYLLTYVRVLFARQPACRGLLNISIKTNFLNVNQFYIHAHQHDPLETGIILLYVGNFSFKTTKVIDVNARGVNMITNFGPNRRPHYGYNNSIF